MKRIVAIITLSIINSVAIAQSDSAATIVSTFKDTIVEKTVQCAQEGNSVCQNTLGKWIFEGSHGFKQDYAKAIAWWMQAAKQDNVESIANLGFCYMYGLGIDTDSSTASRLFEKSMKLGNDKLVNVLDSLANNGSMFCSMLLAHCYKMAKGVNRDNSKALQYYKIAAKHGNVEAMREAAILMRGAKDDAQAVTMFKQAMQKGDLVSTYYYGIILCEGRGIAKDAEAGVKYLRQAADKGYPAAQYELAEAYSAGNGVEKDAVAAFSWYHKAALGGNRAAWWQIAECYREGRGVTMDYEEALEYYAKASDMGFHNKLNALLTEENSEWKNTPFMHYLRGMRLMEIDNNPDAAFVEFGKLSEQLAERKTMESLCMLHPSFKKQNAKKAIKQLVKLSEEGNRRATYELALMQLKGDDMAQDTEKAEKTLLELAKAGYIRAINFLADCYYEGWDVKLDKTTALLLYLQAEKEQRLSPTGATRLADAFRTGDGVKADSERAEQLLKYKASDVNALLNRVR